MAFDPLYVLHFFNYNSLVFYGKLVLCITIKLKRQKEGNI